MKRGFTLIEMLVASVLLGMLVVILTMVFNSSSIAWRTGKAGVAELDKTRRNISLMQREADSAVLVGSDVYLVRSPWKMTSSGEEQRSRCFDSTPLRGSDYGLPSGAIGDLRNPKTGWSGAVQVDVNKRSKADGVSSYTVGVRSYGPDKLPDTADDIDTWPGDGEDAK